MRTKIGNLVAAAVLSTGCAHGAGSGGPSYEPLDAGKVTTLAVDRDHAEFCISSGGPMPTVIATMPGGRQRTTGKAAPFDPAELVWKTSTGSASGTSYLPPRELGTLLEHDVEVTVSLAKNPARSASFVLVPSFHCGAVAVDVSGAMGGTGSQGDGPPNNGFEQPGGMGGIGGPGTRGGDGPQVEVAITKIETKRGPAVVARLSDGRVAMFSPEDGRLTIRAAGGQGGPGGYGANGGTGPDGPSDSGGQRCLSPGLPGGNGGNGGDGGDGGTGGEVLVRIDAAHPELEGLIDVDVSGGAAGDPGQGGTGGSGGYWSGNYQVDDVTTGSCTSIHPERAADGQPGQPGRPGRPGATGHAAVMREPLARLFPAGTDGLFVAGPEPVAVTAPTTSKPTAPTTSKPTAPATSKPTAPTSFSIRNQASHPICVADLYLRTGKGSKVVHDRKNHLKGRLAGRGRRPLTLPDSTAMVRVVSCDKKWVGIAVVLPSQPVELVVTDDPARSSSEISLQSAGAFKGSDFEVK